MQHTPDPTRGFTDLAERRSPRRLLVVGAPWALAGALLVVGLAAGPGTVEDADPSDRIDPAATEDATARPVAAGAGHPTRGDQVALPDLAGDLRLAVHAAAREALGTAGLPGLDATAASWPIEVVVVDVTTLGATLGIATVHGLVIEHDGQRWGAPTRRAVAVPLVLAPVPAVAGAAWPLPAPTEDPLQPATTPVEVGPEVVDVLTDLGWTVDAVVAAALVADAAVAVRIDGTPPDGAAPGTHTVWLPREAVPSTTPSPEPHDPTPMEETP